ncbi:hypothetical protein BH23CHL8_BH23CHL8_28460 [soil metagenome]
MDPTYHDPVQPPSAATTLPPSTVTAVAAAPVSLDEMRPLRWGPIWGGLLTAVGAFFLMTLLAIALGLQAAPGAPAADEEGVGLVAVIVTSAIALIAFFIGGFVSSWSAGLTDQGRSLLNGFLVWALWLVGVILLAAFGLGSFVGAVGEVFGQVTLDAPEIERQELVDMLRTGSWQTFLALALTAAAAALGGVVGAREEVRGMWPRVVAVRPRT